MAEKVQARSGVQIRLTEERWVHIVENHDDLAGHYDEVLRTVEDPECIARGYGGALIAMRAVGRRRYLAVIYKEVSRVDGFIVTAYFTSRLPKGTIIWPRALQRRKQ